MSSGTGLQGLVMAVVLSMAFFDFLPWKNMAETANRPQFIAFKMLAYDNMIDLLPFDYHATFVYTVMASIFIQ